MWPDACGSGGSTGGCLPRSTTTQQFSGFAGRLVGPPLAWRSATLFALVPRATGGPLSESQGLWAARPPPTTLRTRAPTISRLDRSRWGRRARRHSASVGRAQAPRAGNKCHFSMAVVERALLRRLPYLVTSGSWRRPAARTCGQARDRAVHPRVRGSRLPARPPFARPLFPPVVAWAVAALAATEVVGGGCGRQPLPDLDPPRGGRFSPSL